MDPANEPGSPFAPRVPLEPPVPSEPEPPRLGILHLLVWTACVAVWLGWWKTLEEFRPTDGPMDQSAAAPSTLAMTVVYALGVGIALGGLLLWAARRWRRLRFPVHPGEYLLVVMGLTIAAFVPVEIWLAWRSADQAWSMWPVVVIGLSEIGFAVPPLWASFRVTGRLWWAFFLAVTLDRVARGCCMIAMSFSQIPASLLSLALLLVLLCAVLRDRSTKAMRPWTHWSGVVTYAWLTIWELAWTIWNAWLRTVE